MLLKIKTGKGKSNIVASITIIKALQIEYVEILSSWKILAKRDTEEKRNFYKLFWLTCINAEDSEYYYENIVYDNSLVLEGDILRMDFHDSFEKRGGNRKRHYRNLIIDEVGLDNLGSSTRLCAPYPFY